MSDKNINKQIIVLSLPRSGSSLMARILSCLGVDFGKNLQKPDRMNPEGYFEDIEFKKFNGMMRSGGDSAITILRSNMEEFLEKKKGIIGLKNPMACYTLQHWLPLMSAPMIIHLTRNHRDVEKSFSKYPAFKDNYENVLYEWLIAKEKLLTQLNPYPRLRVEYEQLVTFPAQEVKRIAEFTGMKYKEKCLKLIR